VPEDREDAGPPGLWLRRLRESAGLTQEELAERAELATRTISNLESGRIRRPHPRSLRLVAVALGLSAGDSSELQARFRQPPPEDQPEPGTFAVPRQLPSTVPLLAGRLEEIARLDQWLAQARLGAAGPAIFGISGMAGVGKTTLAVHWARRVAGEFPDGQLHVSLGDLGQAGQSAEVAEALSGFLAALGIAPELVPATLTDRSALFRRLVADRKMLILIDNVKDAGQVQAVAPGAAGCVVVATSRLRLAELAADDSARLLNVDVLTTTEAAQLLSARLGPARLRDEAQAAQELIALCGRLPLALVIVAARAVVSGWRLSVLATELADARQRLDALDLGDSTADVRSVFSWSCRQLSAQAASLLRLLALHPGPEFSALAAASLVGLPPALAQASLRELVHANLVGEHVPDRYTVHDLLRLYVAEQARAAGIEAELNAALRRMLDHYLHTTVAAGCLTEPTGDGPCPGPPLPGVTAEIFATEEQAAAWLGAERKVLMAVTQQAAESGLDDYARLIPHAMAQFLDRSGHWHDLVAGQQIALRCAERVDDVAGQAVAQRILGRALQRLGRTDAALAHLNHAVSLLESGGDQAELARTFLNLSVLYDSTGQLDHSLENSLRARDLAEAVGHRPLLAGACNNIGYDYARLGDLQLALEHCLRAIDLAHHVGDPRLEANTWDSLGLVYRRLGDFDQSIACYERALGLFCRIGARYMQADTLSHLGDTYQAAGGDRAVAAWHQALVILRELSHPNTAHLTRKIAESKIAESLPVASLSD